MRRERAAKIIATLGPSTTGESAIRRLVESGADLFRLNLSHGSHEEHAERVGIVRALERAHARGMGLLADLQGPKLRIGALAADGGVQLEPGARFRLDLDPAPGDRHRAPLPHPEVFAALSKGTALLLDDGRIRLEVTDCGADHAETRVASGGRLTAQKGVSVPGATLDLPALTGKDRDDLRFLRGLPGIGWVALSFVQRPEDLRELRPLIGDGVGLMAKIERPAAVDRLDAILDGCDAVMVARGDLGVETSPEQVPVLQKRILRACREAGLPVVVATQMLDSMVDAPRPTRAEASDVATAVYDGADAAMLSAETAVGRYPAAAVAMMARIIEHVERDPAHRAGLTAAGPAPGPSDSDAITRAACQVAETVRAAAIVTFTTSGSTTLRAARERPPVPILALTTIDATARRLTLPWGVHAVPVASCNAFEDVIELAERHAVGEGYARAGDRLVVTAGVPLETTGTTNVLRILRVGEGAERAARAGRDRRTR